MVASAADFVAAGRRYLHGWDYVLGSHGGRLGLHGLPGVDCQGLVDGAAQVCGIAPSLGPVLPWEVAYMVAHSPLRHVAPVVMPSPGWIVVFGNPSATDPRELYAHTGIVTDPPYYVSALNPARGIVEMPMSATGMPVVLYLDTYSVLTHDSEAIMATGNLIATLLDANGNPATSDELVNPAIRLLTASGAMVRIGPRTFPVFGFVLAGVPGHAEPCWLLVDSGVPLFVLARNCSVVPA